jgi:hypothetical protein
MNRVSSPVIAVLAVAMVLAASACASASRPAGAHRSGVPAASSAAASATPAPTPTAHATPYALAVDMMSQDTYNAESAITREECQAYLTDDCAAALDAFAFLIQGAYARIKAAGPPGPLDPDIAQVDSVVKGYAKGIADLLVATSRGDSARVTAADDELDAADSEFQDVVAANPDDLPYEANRVPVTPAPVPASAGSGPDARAPFTLAAQRVDALLVPAMVTVTARCQAILSDDCAAAVTDFKAVLGRAVSDMRGVATPSERRKPALAFGSTLDELRVATSALSHTNATGDGFEGLFADSLFHDAMWHLADSLAALRT